MSDKPKSDDQPAKDDHDESVDDPNVFAHDMLDRVIRRSEQPCDQESDDSSSSESKSDGPS